MSELDLDAIQARYTPADGSGYSTWSPAAIEEDIAALIKEAKRLRFHYGETKFMLEGWERTGEVIGHFIPEHYEAGEGSFLGIVEEWATHAAAVVNAAHTWRKCDRSDAWGDTLDAAVEKIYPSDDYA